MLPTVFSRPSRSTVVPERLFAVPVALAPQRGRLPWKQPAEFVNSAVLSIQGSKPKQQIRQQTNALHALQRAAIDLQPAGALRAQCQGAPLRGAEARSPRRRSAQ